jgi:CheY-like chemotaxis protein
MVEERSLVEGKRILLVDDEPDVLATLRGLLSMCEVLEATNFKDAKNLLETQDFDMAILDIMGVDGYELLKVANRRNVIGVMLTAHALSPDHIMKSYGEGAASYLPKEEMQHIAVFLNDIWEAKARGKHPWWRWLDRLGSYWEKKFGPNWKKGESEFWRKFPFQE